MQLVEDFDGDAESAFAGCGVGDLEGTFGVEVHFDHFFARDHCVADLWWMCVSREMSKDGRSRVRHTIVSDIIPRGINFVALPYKGPFRHWRQIKLLDFVLYCTSGRYCGANQYSSAAKFSYMDERTICCRYRFRSPRRPYIKGQKQRSQGDR